MGASPVQRIRAHYEARVAPERETYEILDWGSRAAQIARFDVLVSLLQRFFHGGRVPALLDVGCGLTDLAQYLDDKGFPVRYAGADITFGVLAEAARRFPGRRLLQADVFAAPCLAAGCVDVCYCSGVFNLQLGNNESFVQHALPRLVDLAGSFAVANFLHRRAPHHYPHCHYYDPEFIVASMERQGYAVSLIDDYLENDFTTVLRRR